MTDLAQQQCRKLTRDDTALSSEEISRHLNQLDPVWQLDNKQPDEPKSDETPAAIYFTFKFDNYYQTMAFVNVIAQIAHQQDHHPDLEVSYNRCTVTYTTHSVGGITINDFICAAKINAAQSL